MNHVLNQLYIIATVCLLICRTPIIRKVKWWLYGHKTGTYTAWFNRRIKPFDCPLCLTFWVSIIINGYLLSIPQAIGIASINALLASELEKHLRK
jgi:hypothetical protein